VEAFQVRFLFTLVASALSIQCWSGNLVACGNSDASAVLATINRYIMPAPDLPQHRWMVSQGDEGWLITEYSGLRVSIRCYTASKADELNGVQYGEIRFHYEATRIARFPELTSAGLQWGEWSQWIDNDGPSLSPFERQDEAFRKSKGKIQLEWEYNPNLLHPALISAANVSYFFSTADAEAAKLRNVEAEAIAAQERLAHENAKLFPPGARLTRPVNPDDYYPPGSIRREEQGSPVVQVCVGRSGKLMQEPVVTDTSGFPELDGAAIKVAYATRYAAGTDEGGIALAKSCLKFRVQFLLKNN
jgi:TonB family protein